MNICLLSSDFLPNIGGIANHVAELARALVKLDNKVIVLTTNHGTQAKLRKEISEDNGVVIIRVPYIDLPKVRGIATRLFYLYYLPKIIKEYNIDIVHWHWLRHDSFATKHIKFPNLIFTNHSSYFLKKMEEKKYDELKDQIFHAKAIITPSDELRDVTIKLGYNSERIFNISNGVDVDRFIPGVDVSSLKESLGINHSDKVVVCARRFVKKNGVKYLVNAIPSILETYGNNVKFVFIGDSLEMDEKSEKAEIVKFIEVNKLSDNVIFTGAIPSEKMPEYFSLGDISVLPSLKEATSLSGLESMACAVPVVGTNIGGIPEIVKHNYNGILVPPMDSDELSKAITFILKEDEMRKLYGMRARDFVVKEFSWISAAMKTIEVYEKAINIEDHI